MSRSSASGRSSTLLGVAAAATVAAAVLLAMALRRRPSGSRCGCKQNGCTCGAGSKCCCAKADAGASSLSSGSSPRQLKLHAGDWKYVGEGNASIVVRYAVAPSTTSSSINPKGGAQQEQQQAQQYDQSLAGSVLRIAKASHPSHEEDAAAEAAHMALVCAPLYGVQYVELGKDALLSAADVAALEAVLEAHRPPGRVAAASAAAGDSAPDTRRGMLSKDLTCMWLPCAGAAADATLSLEIKPKCGALPRSLLVPPAQRLKYRVPRFAALQHFKLACGDGSNSGGGAGQLGWGAMEGTALYEPADLFSGSKAGISAALAALAARPNNFLKLFDRGAAVPLDSAPAGSGAAAAQSPAEAALAASAQQTLGLDLEALLRVTAAALADEPLLSNILALQRLDVLDVAGAQAVRASLEALLGGDANAADERVRAALLHGSGWVPQREDATEFLELFRGKLFVEQPDELTPQELEAAHACAVEAAKSLDVQQCATLLSMWYIAQAAADCSIMLTLAPCAPGTDAPAPHLQGGERGGMVRDPVSGTKLWYCLSAMDLGPKPLAQLKKQGKREPQVWEFVAKVEAQLRSGGEASAAALALFKEKSGA